MERTSHLLLRQLANGARGALVGGGAGFLFGFVLMPVSFADPDLPPPGILASTALGTLAGFVLGFRAWPDPSTRNIQDPPGLHAPRQPGGSREAGSSSRPARAHTWKRPVAIATAPLTVIAAVGLLLGALELALRSAERAVEPPEVTPIALEADDVVGTYVLGSDSLHVNADHTFWEITWPHEDDSTDPYAGDLCFPVRGEGEWTIEDGSLVLRFEGDESPGRLVGALWRGERVLLARGTQDPRYHWHRIDPREPAAADGELER